MSTPQHGPMVRGRTWCISAEVHVRLADAGHPAAAAEVRAFRRRLEAAG